MSYYVLPRANALKNAKVNMAAVVSCCVLITTNACRWRLGLSAYHRARNLHDVTTRTLAVTTSDVVVCITQHDAGQYSLSL